MGGGRYHALSDERRKGAILSQALLEIVTHGQQMLAQGASALDLFRGETLALVVEQLVSANSKNLSGFYVMPDTSFNFDEASLK